MLLQAAATAAAANGTEPVSGSEQADWALEADAVVYNGGGGTPTSNLLLPIRTNW